MITKPTLPALKGYVEVEVNGVRTYRNVKTSLLIDEERRLAAIARAKAEAEMGEPEEVVDETATEPEVAETEPVIGETDNTEVPS